MNIKRPIVSLILSALLPGLGQLYNGQVPKGLLYISIKITITFLRKDPLELLLKEFRSGSETFDNDIVFIVFSYTLAELVLWIYSMIDAKKNAEILNQKRSEQKEDQT